MCKEYNENNYTVEPINNVPTEPERPENIIQEQVPEAYGVPETRPAEPVIPEAAEPAEPAKAPESTGEGYVQSPRYFYSDPWREPVYKQKQENIYNYYSPNYAAAGRQAETASAADAEPQKAPKKKTGSLIAKAIALVLACVILCGAAGAGTAYVVSKKMASGTESASQGGTTVVIGRTVTHDSSSTDTETPKVDGRVLTANQVYKVGLEQVVGVSSSKTTTNIFGQESTYATSGTGFVISNDGYILTNYHVIEYAVEYGYDLKVFFHNEESVPATVIGYYKDNDVAVIKIDKKGLNPVVLGDSDVMEVGERVYCIGNPLGELTFTLTGGYVSALDRLISTDQYTTISMFQIDAAVNNGNSGGPVYNERGEVIGIVSAKYADTGVEGLGFAIPINDAVEIATDLIEHGYVSGKASLGVHVEDVEEYVSRYYNIPMGALVRQVDEGSCAEKAGITAQDIIISVENHKINNVDQLKQALNKYKAGDEVKVKVYRSGTGEVELTVVFDEKVPETNTETDNTNNGQPNNFNNMFPGIR